MRKAYVHAFTWLKKPVRLGSTPCHQWVPTHKRETRHTGPRLVHVDVGGMLRVGQTP